MKDGLSNGRVRTTTQSAETPGNFAPLAVDKVGRMLTNPYQVRDLLSTGSASLTTGTAVSLAAATSGVFKDMIHVSLANNSTTSASVQILADGSVMKTLQVPASSTLSLVFDTPIPAPTANTVWTADMEDVTGTTVTVDALFSNNI